MRKSWLDLTASAASGIHRCDVPIFANGLRITTFHGKRVLLAHEGVLAHDGGHVDCQYISSDDAPVVKSSSVVDLYFVQSQLVVRLRRWILQWTSYFEFFHFCLCHMRRIGALHHRCENGPGPQCRRSSHHVFGLRSRHQLM